MSDFGRPSPLNKRRLSSDASDAESGTPPASPPARRPAAVKKQTPPRKSLELSSSSLSGESSEGGSVYEPEKKQAFLGLLSRVKPLVSGAATAPVNRQKVAALATGKEYKREATRIHWKGILDSQGLTSGLSPFPSERDKKGWSADHERRRDELGRFLEESPEFTPLQHSGGKHGAENSHLVAATMWGPNDALSAPAASVHQNTEWLAIEDGIKHLSDLRSHSGKLRFKATGYVHESGEFKGTMKAARMKVYIDGKKVFDHLADGRRGNIDKLEAETLRDRVKALQGNAPEARPEHSKHFNKADQATLSRGTGGFAPSRGDIRRAVRSSVASPMFTGVRPSGGGGRLTGQRAEEYVKNLLPK